MIDYHKVSKSLLEHLLPQKHYHNLGSLSQNSAGLGGEKKGQSDFFFSCIIPLEVLMQDFRLAL